ncbi:MAG: hypothetical protein M0R46_06810 [Candidatus Muirbacterium halophilum]|nr:hypothetical protein [Candidatus Muirbacterium halophilum]
MKYIRTFNESTNTSEIEAICEKYNIKNYIINDDGSIDVDGHVDLYGKSLKELPLKFRNVIGNFYCSDNKLTSLEGAPQSIGGNFYCISNQLTSLVGCPQYIGGEFNCSYNQLTTLEGAPQSVGGDFYCISNQLTSLVGCPQSIGGNFECAANKLTSLEGSPKRVGGGFLCYSNKLKNIDYLPKYYKELFIGDNPIYKIIKLFITSYRTGTIYDNRENKDLIMDFIDREIIQQDKLLVNRLVEFLDDIGNPKSKEELIELLKNDYEIR